MADVQAAVIALLGKADAKAQTKVVADVKPAIRNSRISHQVKD